VLKHAGNAGQTEGPQEIKLRFADGTEAWLIGGTAFDFVFSPTFLKFTSICILILALLQRRDDVALLDTWQTATLWFVILSVTILWFLFVFSTVRALQSKYGIRSIYTPLVTVPCIFATEVAAQFFMREVSPPQTPLIGIQWAYLAQGAIVVILFDVFFGNFVVSRHPLLHTSKSDKRDTTFKDQVFTFSAEPIYASTAPVFGPEKTELPPNKPDERDLSEERPKVASKAMFVNVAGRQIDPTALVSMKIQDHYLSVVTVNESFLARYKLRDAIKDIGPELGLQINRSTWVAMSHVELVTREGPQKSSLTLKNGNEFVIARSRLSEFSVARNRWKIDQKRKNGIVN